MRSCYTRNMRFVAGQPAILVPATWYFAAPTAKVFPFENSFFSANWNSVHPTASDLGDQDGATRRYYNGRRLNRSDGTSFAGPAAFFRDGCPALTGIPRAEDGTPQQCLPAPFGLAGGGLSVPVVPLIGGKRVGGLGVRPVTPGIPCGNCVGTTPATIAVTASGCTGAAVAYNGTFACPQTGPCSWALLTAVPYRAISITRAPGAWVISLSDLTPETAVYGLTTPDCVTPTSLPIIFPVNGYPATIAISFL